MILTDAPVWVLAASWNAMVPYVIVGFRGSFLVLLVANIVMAFAGGIFSLFASAVASSVPVASAIIDGYCIGTLLPTAGALFRISEVSTAVCAPLCFFLAD